MEAGGTGRQPAGQSGRRDHEPAASPLSGSGAVCPQVGGVLTQGRPELALKAF